MSALPINDRMSVLWALDSRHMQDELLGLLEGGRVPTVEPLVEEDKEEQEERPPTTSEAEPL